MCLNHQIVQIIASKKVTWLCIKKEKFNNIYVCVCGVKKIRNKISVSVWHAYSIKSRLVFQVGFHDTLQLYFIESKIILLASNLQQPSFKAWEDCKSGMTHLTWDKLFFFFFFNLIGKLHMHSTCLKPTSWNKFFVTYVWPK